MTCSLQKITQNWMQSGPQPEASFVKSGTRILFLLTTPMRILSSAELISDQWEPVWPGRCQTQGEILPPCRGSFLRLFNSMWGEPGKPTKKAKQARDSRTRVSGVRTPIPAQPGPWAPPHLWDPFTQVLSS